MSKSALVALFALGLAACSSDDETIVGDVSMADSEQTKTVAWDEVESTITFTTNTDWSASVRDVTTRATKIDWLTLTVNTGKAGEVKMPFYVKTNDSKLSRDAQIEIRCGEKTVTVNVHQNQNPDAIGEPEVVVTYNLTLETVSDDTYAAVAVPGFDAAAALSALGAPSWDDVNWIAFNDNGSYETKYSADAPGYWYDKLGYPGAWGDDASVYTGFDGENILIGQMPGQMPEGSTVTVGYGAIYKDRIVRCDITVVIKAFEDPETAPEGTPESIEKSITLTKPYDADWGATGETDVKEDLRQCFKMTTYQIYSALQSGEMKMWVGEIGNMAAEDGTPAYTGEAPGWWLNGEGAPVSWGDEAVAYVFLGATSESLGFYGGNHPDNCPAEGKTIQTKYIIEYNGTTATYNITFDITAN